MDHHGLQELRALVGALPWRFAKTMPEQPHYYIVRAPEFEDAYVRLFFAVKLHGKIATYYAPSGRSYNQQYLRLGDGWKYWVMTHDIRLSRVINRAQVETAHAPETQPRKNV